MPGYYGWRGEREVPKGREVMFQEEGRVSGGGKSHIHSPSIFQTRTATYLGEGVVKLISELQSAEFKKGKRIK